MIPNAVHCIYVYLDEKWFCSFLICFVLVLNLNFRVIVVRMLTESQTVLTRMSRPVAWRLVRIQVVRKRHNGREKQATS